MAFIDLMKAFNLISRDDLFKILPKIRCLPRLLSIISSSLSDSFDIHNGVKQGCVFAPTLFGIFIATLRKHAFGSATESTEQKELQQLMSCFNKACQDFRLTISLKKTRPRSGCALPKRYQKLQVQSGGCSHLCILGFDDLRLAFT